MVARVQIEAIREVARRVRARRLDAGLSQAELATRADLDRLYLGRFERGQQNPTLLVVARLCVELGTTLEELFRGVEVSPEEARAVSRLSRGPGRRPSARTGEDG